MFCILNEVGMDGATQNITASKMCLAQCLDFFKVGLGWS